MNKKAIKKIIKIFKGKRNQRIDLGSGGLAFDGFETIFTFFIEAAKNGTIYIDGLLVYNGRKK